MRTSSVGRASRGGASPRLAFLEPARRIQRASRGLAPRGVTLVEMLLVMTILALMAGVSYPSIASGVDSLRINGAADEIAALMNAGLAHADRRQRVVELAIEPLAGRLHIESPDLRLQRTVTLPQGVVIDAVLPALPVDSRLPRRFLLYPNGAPPRIGVVLMNSRGARRTVRLDPVSGAPRIERQP